jgi:hypothetical protein
MAPPPSRSRRPALRALLTFLIATILAALTGYYLWLLEPVVAARARTANGLPRC